VLWHDRILHDLLEGRVLGKRKKTDSAVRRLFRNKDYADLKKAVSGEQ